LSPWVRFATVFSALLFLVLPFQAQVATGVPAFGTYGGGPFDTINLGNLNVHFAIPILQKAGRGMPFGYALNYDNSIWTPITTGTVKTWHPALNWGWNAATSAVNGYVTDSETTTSSNSPCLSSTTNWSNYVYHDSLGISHPFDINIWIRVIPCIHPPTSASGGQSGYATDGSGIYLTATTAGWTITLPSGQHITSTSATVTDANGNELTASGGEYFDTLSGTTPVLTVAGSATSSPMTLTYAAPSGSASYTVTYEPYTVATNFGITGVGEYGPGTATTPLVSTITLPDSTSYTFTYEQTPGSCCLCNFAFGRDDHVRLQWRTEFYRNLLRWIKWDTYSRPLPDVVNLRFSAYVDLCPRAGGFYLARAWLYMDYYHY